MSRPSCIFMFIVNPTFVFWTGWLQGASAGRAGAQRRPRGSGAGSHLPQHVSDRSFLHGHRRRSQLWAAGLFAMHTAVEACGGRLSGEITTIVSVQIAVLFMPN